MAETKTFRVLTSIFFNGKICSEGSLIEVTSEEYLKCFDNDKKLVELVKESETPKVEIPEEEIEKSETPKVEITITDELKETGAKYPIQKNGAKK